MKLLHNQQLAVDHENGFTRGHFEGHPIVPGAVSLGMMIDVLRAYLNLESVESLSVKNLKCLEEVAPPCLAEVLVYETKTGHFRVELKIGQRLKIAADMCIAA